MNSIERRSVSARREQENIPEPKNTLDGKKPQDVIGLLRFYNLGDPSESAGTAFERVKKFLEERWDYPLRANEPSMKNLVSEALEKAGYPITEPLVVTLGIAANDFDGQSNEWKAWASKDHEDYRI